MIKELDIEQKEEINAMCPAVSKELQKKRGYSTPKGLGDILNEIITVINAGGDTDEKVLADAVDTTPSHLDAKTKAGAGLTKIVVIDNGVRKIEFATVWEQSGDDLISPLGDNIPRSTDFQLLTSPVTSPQNMTSNVLPSPYEAGALPVSSSIAWKPFSTPADYGPTYTGAMVDKILFIKLAMQGIIDNVSLQAGGFGTGEILAQVVASNDGATWTALGNITYPADAGAWEDAAPIDNFVAGGTTPYLYYGLRVTGDAGTSFGFKSVHFSGPAIIQSVKQVLSGKISEVVADGVTITGEGTIASPLVAVGSGGGRTLRNMPYNKWWSQALTAGTPDTWEDSPINDVGYIPYPITGENVIAQRVQIPVDISLTPILGPTTLKVRAKIELYSAGWTTVLDTIYSNEIEILSPETAVAVRVRAALDAEIPLTYVIGNANYIIQQYVDANFGSAQVEAGIGTSEIEIEGGGTNPSLERDFTIDGDAVVQDGLLYVRLKNPLHVSYVDWSSLIPPTGDDLVLEAEYAPDITTPVWTPINEGTIADGTYEDNNSGLDIDIPAGSVLRFNCTSIGSTTPGNTIMISMGA